VGARYVSQPRIKEYKSKKKNANAGWYGVGRMGDLECWSVRSVKNSFPDIRSCGLFKIWTKNRTDKEHTLMGRGVETISQPLGVHASKISPKLS
jgi:hypothetical protein